MFFNWKISQTTNLITIINKFLIIFNQKLLVMMIKKVNNFL
ncbi:hypothetical protein MCAV_00270 [[Mycoplasma] cavipharyngis]